MQQPPPRHPKHDAEMRAILNDLFAVDSMMEMGLFGRVKAVSHLLRHITGEFRKDGHQSNTRIQLLTHLVVCSRLGKETGLAPSELSDHLGISRNTVSALLNGLEEQDLIERHLNPGDRRQFLIRITPQGADLVRTRAPDFGRLVTSVFEVFTPTEQETLAALLDKLIDNLLHLAAVKGIQVPSPGSDSVYDPPDRDNLPAD
jgi:DNA-binding MarR family transcriptional regulator